MSNVLLPDGSVADLHALVRRLVPQQYESLYSKPASENPVIHHCLKNIHSQYAFEYIHKNISPQELRNITLRSGIPFVYFVHAYSADIQASYLNHYGSNPVEINYANGLAEPLMASLQKAFYGVIFHHPSPKLIKSSLPSNKHLNLVCTLEQADFLEASYLFNHLPYSRTDDLSLMHDPFVNLLWSVGEFLTTKDPLTLTSAVSQLSSTSISLEGSSAIANDIVKSISNDRMRRQLPTVFHPIVELSHYFKSPTTDGWVDYLKMMTPLFDGACASRLQTIQNVFYSPNYPVFQCRFDSPSIRSSLAKTFDPVAFTYLSQDVDPLFYPSQQRTLRTFTFNQEIKYHECA